MPDAKVSFDSYLNVRNAYAPSFDPSGERIAFLMDVTGVPQVWLIDAKGGWPRQLTYFGERVSLVSWSPTANRLLFAMDEGGSERHQLYLADLDGGGEIRALTDSPKVMHIFGGWSPDGESIAYASNERHPAHFDAYVMDVSDGDARMVFQRDGSNSVAAWTPDGKGLVISRDLTSRYNDLTYLDLNTGDARPLSQDGLATYSSLSWDKQGKGIYLSTNRDREFSALAWMDAASGELAALAEPTWDVEAVSLSPDGKRLAYVADEAGYSRLFVRDLESQSEAAVEGLPTGTLQNPRGPAAVAWSPDGGTLAVTANGVASNANIWLCDVASGDVRQLTHADAGGLDPAGFVEPQLVQFTTFDGREVPAFLYAPPNAKPDGANPVIMHVHGGPEGQERPSFNAQYQYFVSRGYCVLAPNVRGSSGYGRTYIHLDDVRKRMDSVRDLESAWNWLRDSGWADPKRVAVMGGSYGGFMVLSAITTYPDLWAAAVELYGIANFETFLENTSSYRRKLRESEYGNLEDDSEFLREISPIHYVDRIRAPLLVLHGATDPRVPISETEQIVKALSEQGKVVEYVRFEDEGHGFVKRGNRLTATSAVSDFFDRHLPAPIGGDAEIPSPLMGEG